jgi:hypothetical protein
MWLLWTKKSCATYTNMRMTATPRDKKFAGSGASPHVDAVGIISATTANSSTFPIVSPDILLKYCSLRYNPPTKNPRPNRNSIFDKMLPTKESRKTSI